MTQIWSEFIKLDEIPPDKHREYYVFFMLFLPEGAVKLGNTAILSYICGFKPAVTGFCQGEITLWKSEI
jgi:hypothetical protein